MGIKRQMKAKQVNVNGVTVWKSPRAAQNLRIVPAPHLVNDGKANITSDSPAIINVQRSNALNYLKPVYR